MRSSFSVVLVHGDNGAGAMGFYLAPRIGRETPDVSTGGRARYRRHSNQRRKEICESAGCNGWYGARSRTAAAEAANAT